MSLELRRPRPRCCDDRCVEASDLDTLGLEADAVELVLSAERWLDSAMDAWAADDFAKVGLMTPTAVEHLGKAYLWSRNPALLVQLASQHEGSLVELATSPSIASKTLKTIGLEHVITRIGKVVGGTPALSKERRDRLVNVRNGITHVGAADLSRDVLLDSITMLNALLDLLSIERSAFYSTHSYDVVRLLEEKRTEVGHRVLANLAAARRRVDNLRESLGDGADQTLVGREARRTELRIPAHLSEPADAIDHTCPACEYIAKIFGDLDLEEAIDYDVEPLGGGQYETVAMPFWEVWFTPEAFACNVCRLTLHDREELAEAGIDTERQSVEPEELSDDFDMDEFVRWHVYDDTH